MIPESNLGTSKWCTAYRTFLSIGVISSSTSDDGLVIKSCSLESLSFSRNVTD